MYGFWVVWALPTPPNFFFANRGPIEDYLGLAEKISSIAMRGFQAFSSKFCVRGFEPIA
jgi:hypothetical protein